MKPGGPTLLTRRRFLPSSSLLAPAPAAPLFLATPPRRAPPPPRPRPRARPAPRSRAPRAPGAPPEKARPPHAVVQPGGGNDALITVLPHGHPVYAKLRPTLRVAAKDVVPLTDVL